MGWDHFLTLRMVMQAVTLGFAMSNCFLLLWALRLLTRLLGRPVNDDRGIDR